MKLMRWRCGRRIEAAMRKAGLVILQLCIDTMLKGQGTQRSESDAPGA